MRIVCYQPSVITHNDIRSRANRLLAVFQRGLIMIELSVPTLNNSEEAKKLKETILTSEPDAQVEVDSEAKTVKVESEASAETFKQLIVAAGHKLG